MAVSRRSFFGIAAGAAAVVAGAAPAVAAEVQTGFDLAAAPDVSAVWIRGMEQSAAEMLEANARFLQMTYFYGVEGHRFGGLLQEAANKPVVHSPAVRAAIADQERRRRASQKKFERMLSSPIGEGRLE